MSQLAWVSIFLGVVVGVFHVCALVFSKQILFLLRQFPRNKPTGWSLVTIVMVYSGILLYESPLGGLEKYRNLIFILIPLAIVLSCFCIDQLLAPRALGALLIIFPSTIIEFAQWHYSSFRMMMIIIAYVLVIWGCILVVSPYYFRKATDFFYSNYTRLRILCGMGIYFGIFLIWLGIAIY